MGRSWRLQMVSRIFHDIFWQQPRVGSNELWAAPPCFGSLSVSRASGSKSAWEVAEVRNVSSSFAKSTFWKHRTAVLNISKQQLVWDQSAALGFITQISSVIVPKQKVWLACEEHPCGMGALLWNEYGWMGKSGEGWMQNLSDCTFHMMKFPLLKQTRPKERGKKKKKNRGNWVFFVVELCFTCCSALWNESNCIQQILINFY